jgi:predicted small lipoprotein YifL
MRRFFALALIGLMAATTLSACGKKGPLELPNGKTANPEDVKHPEQQNSGTDEGINR